MADEAKEHFRDLVLKEYEKGNIVFMGFDGPMVSPLANFLTQPIEGILYDLNRDEATVITFIEDKKWVNDYAVCKVIRELKTQLDAANALLSQKEQPNDPAA